MDTRKIRDTNFGYKTKSLPLFVADPCLLKVIDQELLLSENRIFRVIATSTASVGNYIMEIYKEIRKLSQ